MNEWSVPKEGTKEFLEFAKEILKAKEKYRQKLERQLAGNNDMAIMRRTAPEVDLRRGGKVKKKDQEYQEAILDTQRDLELLAFAESLLARFDRGSRKMITSLIWEMETDDEELPEGSLAQIAGQAITLHTVKNLTQFHMDIANLFSRAAQNRRFKGTG